MRITEAQLRRFIRESLITEIEDEALAVAPADRHKNLAMDPETKQRVLDAMTSAVEGTIDFTKGLGEMMLDVMVYFKSGQVVIDSIRGLSDVDITPEDEREWRATIAAASLHDFLDKFGTAGLDAADLTNGFLYMLEGNWKMAALCSIGAVPIVGSAIADARKAGKFAIKASEVAALDAGINDVKQGLKASGMKGADEVIAEVDKIRADMNGQRADFKPYENIPPERQAAAEAVAKDPQKLEQASRLITRSQAAARELRAAANIRAQEPAFDYTTAPRRASDFLGGEIRIGQSPVPMVLSPAAWAGGQDLLKAWNKYADHNFFRNRVKNVHWLGFSSEESRSASKALDDFLSKSGNFGNVQISTVGYTQDLVPPKNIAGRTFDFGEKVQVGIKLKGDAVYATTADAFTTNPSAKARRQMAAGEIPAKFQKVPRPDRKRAGEIARISDPDSPYYDAALHAEYVSAVEDAKAAARQDPAFDLAQQSYYRNKEDAWPKYVKWPESFNKVVAVAPEGSSSELMLGAASWHEINPDWTEWNEVVLDNWQPEAVILDTKTATKQQIESIADVAKKHNLQLLDPAGNEIKLSDFELQDRSDFEKRVFGKDYSEPGETLDLDQRSRQYEGIQLRWGKLAGLMRG
jgi:hypothetical protein